MDGTAFTFAMTVRVIARETCVRDGEPAPFATVALREGQTPITTGLGEMSNSEAVTAVWA